MAEYKNMKYLHPASDAAFDVRNAGGTKPANSGIYRCTGCNGEICVSAGRPLPTHEHEDKKKVEWLMVVRAEELRRI